MMVIGSMILVWVAILERRAVKVMMKGAVLSVFIRLLGILMGLIFVIIRVRTVCGRLLLLGIRRVVLTTRVFACLMADGRLDGLTFYIVVTLVWVVVLASGCLLGSNLVRVFVLRVLCLFVWCGTYVRFVLARLVVVVVVDKVFGILVRCLLMRRIVFRACSVLWILVVNVLLELLIRSTKVCVLLFGRYGYYRVNTPLALCARIGLSIMICACC